MGVKCVDTKFSVAVHLLILISESPEPLNSEQMAGSTGNNSSYVRKILSLLKKAGIVEGHKGISGYKLTAVPNRLTLLAVYQAVTEEPKIHLFDIHQNPNDKCIVGRHIKPMLGGMFGRIEKSFAELLDTKTLADCILEIRNEIDGNP